ncbi:MAG TPA: DNA methyltransferase, partial [Candidatus Aquilonibacter sp.]|nr:DNA methyltransferase [Candidatus Aquilonibacter sp.]
MTKKKNYNDWSKEELIKEVEVLKKQKTFGLVWEKDKTNEVFDYYINWDGIKNKEKFAETEGKFPVLKEVKGKEIVNEKNGKYNLLIEGDNYHSLAVLNFTHSKAIDVIYIDPPYNTGHNDFRYNDQWVDIEDAYRHSKWLSFMEKRLKLARELLKEDGVIFISIDDNEFAQLKILCDEIFIE